MERTRSVGRRTGRGCALRVAIIALGALAAAGPAAAKETRVHLSADPGAAVVGQRIAIGVRVQFMSDDEPEPRCRVMRVLAVAPGVSVQRALRVVEGQQTPGRIGAWDAFRLGSLKRTGPLTWRGVLRPNRPGRWTVVVPNVCSGGFVTPLGVTRAPIAVHR